MRIAFLDTKRWEERYLSRKLKDHQLEFPGRSLSSGNLKKIRDSEILSIFIHPRIDRRILEKLPKLQMITTRSTGFEHIDLEECRRRHIVVCSVPSYGENTVAEHTFALILSLSRNIHKSYVRTLRSDFSTEGLKGFDLKGKTLGVIGAGQIGLHVIRIARSFGMNVLAYDTRQQRFLSEVLGFNYVSLEELLKGSDIISLHVPYNKHTHHLLNKKSMTLIKKGAILINTSRGEVVDTEALIQALDKKILQGAGLDVLEGEELMKKEDELLYTEDKAAFMSTLVKGHILLAKDNVVFTPHIAFYSQEALERILDTTLENILGFVSGSPLNVVQN